MTSTSQDHLPTASRAVLVAAQLPGLSDEALQSSLDELERLAQTLGLRPVARLTQRRSSAGAPSLLGAGKLRELARLTGGPGVVPPGAAKRRKGALPAEPDAEAEPELGSELESELESELDSDLGAEQPSDRGSAPEPWQETSEAGEDDRPVGAKGRASVVICDHELSPNQLRNLESATAAEVLDRPSLIISIFQRHARTREAKLQVEIARLKYLAPRLRATGASPDRQRGGVGGLGGRGAGESSLELDRRQVRDRVAQLKEELVLVQREATTRRARRRQRDLVALVGYTNAGKSSLMRALTGSEILVADQLFATLGTTVRVLRPETLPRILVSDTVGFIKKLPHDLVASFRSTLEEAAEAALLLLVVDASDPSWPSQLEVTREVLGEIGAGKSPALLVLNKADRLDEAARAALAAEHPEALVLSALRTADVAALHRRILAHFETDMVEGELFVRHAQARMVHAIHEACRVLARKHEEEGTRLRVLAPRELIDQLRARVDQAATAAGPEG